MDFVERLRSRHLALTRDREDSAGFTILELMVALAIFTIVAVIVTGQLNLMPIFEGRISNAATTSDQVTSAFLTLDGEVRYAADINHPWTDGSGNYWDEFESDWASASQGYPLCTELEYVVGTGVLQQRTWPLTTPSAPAAPGTAVWRPLSTGLSKAPATAPFALSFAAPKWATASGTGVPNWQMTFTLTDQSGGGQTTMASTSSFTITAINTTSNSKYRSVCGGAP